MVRNGHYLVAILLLFFGLAICQENITLTPCQLAMTEVQNRTYTGWPLSILIYFPIFMQ